MLLCRDGSISASATNGVRTRAATAAAALTNATRAANAVDNFLPAPWHTRSTVNGDMAPPRQSNTPSNLVLVWRKSHPITRPLQHGFAEAPRCPATAETTMAAQSDANLVADRATF